MRLTLNGETREVTPPPATVEGLLLMLGVPRERVAVELNGELVVKQERGARALKDGDVLEIVTLVGGG